MFFGLFYAGNVKNDSKIVIFMPKYLVDNNFFTTFALLDLNKVFYESSESKQDPPGLAHGWLGKGASGRKPQAVQAPHQKGEGYRQR